MTFEQDPWLLIPFVILTVEGWRGLKWFCRRWWDYRSQHPDLHPSR